MPRSAIPFAAVSALTLLLASFAPAIAQQPQQAQRAQPGTAPAAADTPQQRAAAEMLGMVRENGAMAGAVTVCHAPLYDEIRACTIAFASQWEVMGGVAVPIDATGRSVIERTWNRAATSGRSVQSSASPPLACPALIEQVRQASFWEVCNRMRDAIRQASGTPGQPQRATAVPQQPPVTRTQVPQAGQPPRQSGGFVLQ